MSHNEAPASANFFWEDGQFKGQFTLRGENELAVLERLQKLMATMSEQGYAGTSTPKYKAGDLDTPDGQKMFVADTLLVEQSGDSIYFKLQGFPFNEYGIRVWPEVLTEYTKFDPKQAKPGKFPIPPQKAFYEEWEADGKTRRKVVRLELEQ